MVNNKIKCPHCEAPIDVESVIASDLEKKYRSQFEQQSQESQKEMAAREQQLNEDQARFEEKKKKENELFMQRINQEKQKIEAEAQERLQTTIAADYEHRLQLLQSSNKDMEEKVRQGRDKELTFLKKEQELQNREAEMELVLQRKLQEERNRLSEDIRRLEQEKNSVKETEFLLKQKELEKQLDDQRRLIEEMKRRAEQGSMQLQGESQELVLEDMLRNAFPFDLVAEVGKGIRGADCIQTVRNSLGQECGRIIYESKRTKHFDKGWLEKLKADMRSTGCEMAILVSQALPDDVKKFTQADGVWICTFEDVVPLAHVLRDAVLKIFLAGKSQENKGDKMQLLYDYLTGREFAEQWKAIQEGFVSLKNAIQRERDAMERLWKAREKQLEKVLLNASHFRGSIEGIAGLDTDHLKMLTEMEEMVED